MRSRRLRNLILMMTAPLLLFCFLYLVFIAAPRLYNNWKLKEFKESMEAIKLPEDSNLIDSKSDFGILGGNSNHCDAEVIILVESDLEPQAFTSFLESNPPYIELPYKGADVDRLQIYYTEEDALFQIDGPYAEDWDETTYISIESGSKNNIMSILDGHSPSSRENIYILRAFDQTFEGYAMNDLRCH